VTCFCLTRKYYRTNCHDDEYHANRGHPILVLINNLASVVPTWRSCEFTRRTWHKWHKIYSLFMFLHRTLRYNYKIQTKSTFPKLIF
jgi:hypothetical protein